MAIGGDPDTLRDKARVLRTWALDVQTTRDSVAAGSGVQWVSTAADRYRERLAEHSLSIGDARDEMIDAAEALEALAQALEARQELIRRAMNAVTDAVDGAKSTLGRLWGWAREELSDAENAARDKAQDLVDSLSSLPPIGDPEWIDIGKDFLSDVKEKVT